MAFSGPLWNEVHAGAVWDPQAHPTDVTEVRQSETEKQVFLPTLLTYQESEQWKKNKFTKRDVVCYSLLTEETPEGSWLGSVFSTAEYEKGSTGLIWTGTSVFTSLVKMKACQISYMKKNHSRLQNFLRLLFERGFIQKTVL